MRCYALFYFWIPTSLAKIFSHIIINGAKYLCISVVVVVLKDGAYFCYCAYVLRISRYSGSLWVVPTNTGIFLRGLKLCGESRT